MWELDYKDSWVLKNCFWTAVLEKTLASPLDWKEFQPVHPKVNQFWIFVGRTDAEAETLTIWPPKVKNWLIWKDPDAEKDWNRGQKGTTEDEMVGWHHWLNWHEFESTGVGNGQGRLVCCSPRGHKESDMTEQLNWTENMTQVYISCLLKDKIMGGQDVKKLWRTSLVVQLLRILTSTAGGMGSIPNLGTKILHTSQLIQKKNFF